jgi:hypothetical protein
MSRKIKYTFDIFVEKANKKHKGKYLYKEDTFDGITQAVDIFCIEHGWFKQQGIKHVNGQGCKECSYDNKKTGLAKFIEQANVVHKGIYEYTAFEYINSRTESNIICKKHGLFPQIPANHLRGQGCPLCGRDRTYAANALTREKFIEISNEKHKCFYGYSLVEYINNYTVVKIICPIHGIFEQKPLAHMRGHKCQKCFADSCKNSLEEFIQMAIIAHPYDTYGYTKVIYINNKTPVLITCEQHGEFPQRPTDHLDGRGCPKCSNMVSIGELEWLDFCNVPKEYQQISIRINGKRVAVDGFNPNTNTVYEYNGDYWHGNPMIYDPNDIHPENGKTFGQLYNDTIKREQLIKSAGYDIISIWASEWLEQKKTIRNK